MINTIVTWLTNIIATIGYPGVALAMFIESFFAPIPSELIMPFAGFLASQGKMNLFVLAFLGGISSYLGSLPFYFIGKVGNKENIDKFLDKYGKWLFIKKDDVEKGFLAFDKFGNTIVLIGRLIPIIRTVISFPAGMAKMNFAKFSAYTLIGSILWSAFLSAAGYLLGNNWEIVGDYVSKYELVVKVAVITTVIIFIVYKLYKHFKNKRHIISSVSQE